MSSRRRWAFRIAAMFLGLLPFLFGEAALRAFNWRPIAAKGDPFVEFHSVRPLFVRSKDGERMEIASERLEFFRPASFAAAKSADEFRIFCLGGSTVQGRPYAVETSFTTWLELSLRAADETKDWQVINGGGVSYASYRLAPILEEVLDYEPDLILIYMGHNEFLEDRSYSAVKNTPTVLAQAYSGLSQLRTVQLIQQATGFDQSQTAETKDREVLTTEVDALLDYEGGLADYHRDDAWQDSVVAHFEINLRRMIEQAGAAKVPLLLVDPPVNLKDCPPFKVAENDGTSDADLEKCAQLIEQARSTASDDRNSAINLYREAIDLNDRNAARRYEFGQYCFRAGEFDEANLQFVAAKDEDICPLRIVEPIRNVLRNAASESYIPLLELRNKFEQLSEGEIPGDNLFVDHVHPTIRGHQIVAEEIADMMREHGLLKPASGWRERRKTLFETHFENLDLVYFERGKQRLEGLQLWSQGRAKKQRNSSLPAKKP